MLQLKAATEDLPKREATRKKLEERAARSDIESARQRIDKVIERFENSTAQKGSKSNSLPSSREVHAEISSIVDEYKLKQESTSIVEEYKLNKESASSLELFARGKGRLEDQTSGREALAVGQKVLVRKLGKAPVTITGLPQKDSKFLTVQLGTLKMQVKPTEVVKIIRSGSGSSAAPKVLSPYGPLFGPHVLDLFSRGRCFHLLEAALDKMLKLALVGIQR